MVHRGVQRSLQLTGADGGVRGDDAQHRGELGGDHARSLDHAADAISVAFQRYGLRLRVRRHDGVGRVASRLVVVRQGRVRAIHSRQHNNQQQQLTDQASGTYGDLVGLRPDEIRDLLGRRRRLLVSRLAGACVGSTGVEDHRLDMAVGDRLAGPLHRCRAESVEREHAGRAVERPLIDDQGEILLALDGGDARRDARGAESFGECDTHGATPIFVSPLSSGSPSATFSDCTAWPAVPRFRLSMAAKAMRRPACRSVTTCT